MGEHEVTNQTVKGHGYQTGDTFRFYGGNWTKELSVPVVVKLGKEGVKYTLTDVYTGEAVMTMGSTAKFLSDSVTDNDGCWERVTARTLDNGDTVWTGECVHGWMTGFHVSQDDATAVVRAHGKVSRPLYVAPVEVPARVDNTCPRGGQHEASFRHVVSSHNGLTTGTCRCGRKVRSLDFHVRDYVTEAEMIAIGAGDHCSNGRCADCDACKLAYARFLAGGKVAVGDAAYVERTGQQGVITAELNMGFSVPCFKIDFGGGAYTILTYAEMISQGYEVIPAAEYAAGMEHADRVSRDHAAVAVKVKTPVRALLNRRKRKASKVNRRKVKGGF